MELKPDPNLKSLGLAPLEVFKKKFLLKIFSRPLAKNDIKTASFLRKREYHTPRLLMGFTIVELVISTGLFVILMTMAVGSFIQAIRTQKVLVSLMAVNDNTGLNLEQMTREIRTGYNFSKISNSELQFVNADNISVRYRLNNHALEKGTGLFAWDPSNPNPTACSGGILDSNGGFCYQKITADNTSVKNFNIEILGNNAGDGYPPRITLDLSITSTEPDVKKLNISTNIQTTISARAIDT